jgi:Na+-transporting NADH:ubiquinone oxidoreductase subunit B
MRKVVYALAPLWLFSIFLYGWKALTITAVVFVAGISVRMGHGKG